MVKTARLSIRINPEEKKTLEEGAKTEGRSTSDFIRLAALAKSQEVLKKMIKK